jgi:L-fuconolactonase
MIRVDAHHHVWRLDRGDYGWLQPTPALAPICRDFLLEDLEPYLRVSGITATVLVQAAPTVAETRFLLDCARRRPDIVRGVVGWVDLRAPTAIAVLHGLTRNPQLKSIRPMLQDEPDADWILRPDVQPALRAIAASGLRFDALVKPRNLPSLHEMLRRHRDLRVVIDHAAKPDIAARTWQPWADQIADIATTTSACCKLSGLVTEASAEWSADLLQPYVDHVLVCFGPDRVLWGSDWPVLTLASTYAQWDEASERLLGALSAEARAAVRGGNAIRFYGLDFNAGELSAQPAAQ